jgi:hypothetical protein
MHDCSSLGPFCAVAITIGVSAGGRLLGCCCNEACLLHWFLLVWIKSSEECPAGPRRKGRKSKLCPSGKIQSLSFQMSEARVLDTEGKLVGSFSSDSCNPNRKNGRKVGTLSLGQLENFQGKCCVPRTLHKDPAFRDREKPILVASSQLHPQSMIVLRWQFPKDAFGRRRCRGGAPHECSQQPSRGLST